MRFWPAITLVALLHAPQAWPAEVWIGNGWTCADWASLRSSETSFHIENYLGGILDGMAMASGRDFWRTPYKIEPKQAYHWMDQYCTREPLGLIAPGAYVLATERLGAGWATQGQD